MSIQVHCDVMITAMMKYLLSLRSGSAFLNLYKMEGKKVLFGNISKKMRMKANLSVNYARLP